MWRRLLTPRWVITTLLAAAAVAGMIRLGIWQLDRLEQRREFNSRVTAQMEAPALSLPDQLPQDVSSLYNMEYREVSTSGEYDFQHEVLLRNQAWEGQPGYHLITPLRLSGTPNAILVDRGFVTLEEGKPEARAKYIQDGPVHVSGILRRPVIPRYFGVPDPTLAPGETRLDAWNAIRLDRIQEQTGYPLLPVYLLAAPDPAHQGPPYSSLEEPDLSEGPHMGYALQWFSFAGVLVIGYPFFLRKHLLVPDQEVKP
jgi:surfeit locus 1 family protein